MDEVSLMRLVMQLVTRVPNAACVPRSAAAAAYIQLNLNNSGHDVHE